MSARNLGVADLTVAVDVEQDFATHYRDRTSSVAGLMFWKVRPDCASTSLPSMRRRVSPCVPVIGYLSPVLGRTVGPPDDDPPDDNPIDVGIENGGQAGPARIRSSTTGAGTLPIWLRGRRATTAQRSGIL